MIKPKYILRKTIEKIESEEATIIESTNQDKKTIVARNIIGDDYIIIIKKNNKSNLKM